MAFADPVDFICFQTETELEKETLAIERLCSLYSYVSRFNEQYPENAELTQIAVESIDDTLQTIALEDLGLLDELVSIEALDDKISIAKNAGATLMKIIRAVIKGLTNISNLLIKFWDRFLGAAASRLKEAQAMATDINLKKREMVLDPRDNMVPFRDPLRTVLDHGRGTAIKVAEITNNIETILKLTDPEKAQRATYDAILHLIDYQKGERENPEVIKDIAGSLWRRIEKEYDATRVIDNDKVIRYMIKVGSMPQTVVLSMDKEVKSAPRAELKMIKHKVVPKEIESLSPEDAHDITNLVVQLLSVTRDQTDIYDVKNELNAVTKRLKNAEKEKEKPDAQLLKQLPGFVRFSVDFTKACANSKLAISKDILSYVRSSAYKWKRK